MSLLQIIPNDLKTVGASVMMLAATAGEAVVSPAGWESITLKVALVAAVIYLVNELKQERDKNKSEATKREDVLIATLKTYQDAAREHSEALQDLRAATETQTGYFKTVAQTLLNRDYHPKLPE